MKIVGHRGAKGLVAENTLASVAKAVSLGVSGIEIDVHLLKDGYFAVHHNFLYSSQGPALRDLDIDDLRAVSGTNFLTRVPLLFEALETLRGVEGLDLYAEIKTDPTRPDLSSEPMDVVNALLIKLETHHMCERVIILAFDWRVLSLLCARAPDVRRGYLTSQETYFKDSPWLDGAYHEDPSAAVRLAGGSLWLPHHKTLTQEQVTLAHEKGMEIIPWTVNDLEDAQRLKSWHVDGLITDFPDRFVEKFLDASGSTAL